MFNKNSLKIILEKIAKANVLVIGDSMLDSYIIGNVERISPEAPIPIMKIEENFFIPGGAGNVALNLSSLGVKSYFISLVGKDDAGKKLIKILDLSKNINANIVMDKSRKTSIKTRYIGNSQQLLRTDEETTNKMSRDVEKQIFQYYVRAIKKSDVVIISDYGKGIFWGNFCQRIIKLAINLKKNVIVDPKNNDFSLYKGAYCITPNIKEAYLATNVNVKDNYSAEKCGLHIIEKNWSKTVLLTRGKEGLSIIEKSNKTHFKADTEEVYDVSGAGDTVVAFFAASIAAKLDTNTAAELANLAAGIVVKKSGAATVNVEEMLLASKQKYANKSKNNHFDEASIKQKISEWKINNLNIGFTNGCFDLLHSGHIETLKKASSVCDRLIVAINSDSSIKKIKGAKRPIQDEKSRLSIISSLSMVDAVVLFNENTPLKLIKLIKPDFLIKGEDYKTSQIVGANIISKWGGKIVRTKLVKNRSTTKLIELINQNIK